MILSDKQIREHLKSSEIFIEPFDESCVQPASYDLHLANEFKIFRTHISEVIDPKKPVSEMMESIFIGDDGFFILHPGAFALALVSEITGVNEKHVGRLEGKSSLARLGLVIHSTGGFLDAGNCLRLTLHLFNASPLPIKLYPKMRIAQIIFEELDEKCEKPYGSEGLNSKYFMAESIEESKMYLNFKNGI